MYDKTSVAKLTSDIAPHKIRFSHILHDVQLLICHNTNESDSDFKAIQQYLTKHYQLSEEELLRQGLRRAYRQVVEGM